MGKNYEKWNNNSTAMIAIDAAARARLELKPDAQLTDEQKTALEAQREMIADDPKLVRQLIAEKQRQTQQYVRELNSGSGASR